MGQITKNLLLALSLVCVIALIVFCIQLIVINRGVEPVGTGSTISGGSQTGSGDAGPASDGEEPPDGNGDIGGEGNIPTPPPTSRPPPTGTRHSIAVTEESRLIIYVREDRFDFEVGELDWWFTYNAGGHATLEIRFEMVTGQGIGAHAESFLNRYSNDTGAEFTGEENIQGSSLMGYHVISRLDSGTYEAWIHLLESSDLALVFVINYETTQQRDALYEALSSIDIE